jgi:hypothetical protein
MSVLFEVGVLQRSMHFGGQPQEEVTEIEWNKFKLLSEARQDTWAVQSAERAS